MDEGERLAAVEEIKQLKAKYWRGVNQTDGELVRSILADDVTFAGPFARLDNAEDCVNGFLFQLPKAGVRRAELVGLWDDSPLPANDVTQVYWK